MDLVYVFLKVVTLGFIGFFILKIFDHKSPKSSLGFFSPFYLLFSILSVVTDEESFFFILLSGLVWGYIVNLYLKTATRSLAIEVHPLMYGIFNILNVYLLTDYLDLIFKNISSNVVIVLAILITSLIFIDLSLTLRKNI